MEQAWSRLQRNNNYRPHAVDVPYRQQPIRWALGKQTLQPGEPAQVFQQMDQTVMEQETNEDVAIIGDGLGPAPFIVEVGCVLAPKLIVDLPNASVLCFDRRASAPEIPPDSRRFRHVWVRIGHRTDAFEVDGALIQVRALDHFWEEYRFPIDLLICNVPEYAKVILGGRRIVFESRFVAVRESPDAEQDCILGAMLPDFRRASSRNGYLIYVNKTF